jgi:hypothetical protein
MRQSRSSGSVGARSGNRPLYPDKASQIRCSVFMAVCVYFVLFPFIPAATVLWVVGTLHLLPDTMNADWLSSP